jgi:hypothetical protein
MSKIEAFWKDATADDVAETIKTGKPIPARVRNEEGDSWRDDAFLWGWINGNWAARGAYWTFCQVYREPSWWTERPDPGPGYRLLEKFPDEPKLGTDEAWQPIDGRWDLVRNDDGIQAGRTWYRRCIEPVEPEPKHYVLRVGDSVETPSGHLISVVSPGVEQIEFKLKAGFTAKLPNGQTIKATEKSFEVTQ